MLSRYNAVDIEMALRAPAPAPPFPPSAEREAWNEVRTQLGEEAVAECIDRAERAAGSAIPALPATLFLEFQRTGQREGYQAPRQQRRQMLSALTIAECLENRGRFLDAILDVAWAICEESSWVLPAHQRTLTDSHYPIIDLGVAMTALDLAEMDLLVGKRLDPLLGKRIRDEVDRRCTTPYLTRHDHWWLYNTQRRRVNNWNAVCNGGLVGAALYLEPDPARLAAVIARAARSLDDYLETFDADGGSSEGPGYWSYGFGYYTVLAHLVEQRTGGEIRFLDGERLRQIAAYPLRTVLSRGVYVNFSDCDPDAAPEQLLLNFLANRLDRPDLAALGQAQHTAAQRDSLPWALRRLFWQPPADTPAQFTPARHDWFSGMLWMVARVDPADPEALVLAAKGGHNGEMHNQNDVGNFIVHINRESLIADVGRGRYTKAYFGPERYEHFVNSSLGHSVPVPNGFLQRVGEQHAAHLLEHSADAEKDTLDLELKGAYPAEAGLHSLRRQLTLHRAAHADAPRGWIELVDTVQFAKDPGTFETALTTFNEVEIGLNGVIIRGIHGQLRVGFDPDIVNVHSDLHEDIDFSRGPMDVQRIVFARKERVQQGAIRLELVPI